MFELSSHHKPSTDRGSTGKESDGVFRSFRHIRWLNTALWHALALSFATAAYLGNATLATGVLVVSILLALAQMARLMGKRRQHLLPATQKKLRQTFRRTLPRRMRALRERVRLLVKRNARAIRRNLLPHRISYLAILLLVVASTAPVSVTYTAVAVVTFTALPLSILLVKRAIRQAHIQNVLSELLPQNLADSSPPEPFQSAPNLGPSSGKKILTSKVASGSLPSMSIVRIIGNDLPPRHKDGQTLANLEFLLRHEPKYPRSTRTIVLNRIIDPERRAELRQVAEREGFDVHEIPFKPQEYRAQPFDHNCLPFPGFLESETFTLLPRGLQLSALNAVFRFKNCYAINNNGARNAALTLGLAASDWALPLDGNVFLPANGWSSLATGIMRHPDLKYWVLPMRRLTSNHDVYRKRPLRSSWEEPQIAFSQLSSERFREDLPYGRRPKVDLLWRLGVPGSWQELTQLPWDQPYPEKSADFGAYGTAGEVLRLNSGKTSLETGLRQSSVASKRNQARDEARLSYLVMLEREFGHDDGDNLALLELCELVLKKQ